MAELKPDSTDPLLPPTLYGKPLFPEMAATAGTSCCDLGCADDPGCACEGCEKPKPSLRQRLAAAFHWYW